MQVPAHPLNRIGIHIRRRHLDRRRKIDDHLALRRGLENLQHRVAHLDGVLQLGARVRLRRVLVKDVRLGADRLGRDAHTCPVGRDLLDSSLVLTKHHVTLQHTRRVVQVHDRLLRTDQRLIRASDQMLARLRQHLDRDVIGNRILFDQLPDEIKISLRGRRKPDLDLLVPHLHQQIEHDPLALRTHRINQRLVPVTQIHRAPTRRLSDALRRPRTIRQIHPKRLVIRAVLMHRHTRRLLHVFHLVLHSRVVVRSANTNTATSEAKAYFESEDSSRQLRRSEPNSMWSA